MVFIPTFHKKKVKIFNKAKVANFSRKNRDQKKILKNVIILTLKKP